MVKCVVLVACAKRGSVQGLDIQRVRVITPPPPLPLPPPPLVAVRMANALLVIVEAVMGVVVGVGYVSLVSMGWRRHRTWHASEERVVARAPSLRQYNSDDDDKDEDEDEDEGDDDEDDDDEDPPPAAFPSRTGREHPAEVMVT